ncbi:FmdB family zinc ribbon protein [Aquabacterium sp. OR-4]|uniref:FmdB family zinc ribbon protein n=1 Tax=Aquabacterium sp. OR-4 TaxID=2978127 RepID=UPI0028C58C65|nr:zinc ribbon domain-containing protein [Aquabacterium sp. OR-4]MDT7838767.1 zinc ribbon domain-containing protein [Aquabacterium sp. OR-4]
MPIHDYHCHLHADFEMLVRSSSSHLPACPHCGSAQLQRLVSRLAPAGKIEAIRMSNRRAADRAGHFNHYSPAERAKLLKTSR